MFTRRDKLRLGGSAGVTDVVVLGGISGRIDP